MKETNARLAEILLRMNSVDVSRYAQSFLGTSLLNRTAETGRSSAVEYLALMEHDAMERAAFIDSLRISYSKFFRNPITFAVLEGIVLPSLLLKKSTGKRKEIRIWSAACAGGEEAYSLAILLEELGRSLNDKCDYRIFATDQSEAKVQEAIQGQYDAAALSNLSLKRAEEWFTRQGGLYTVKPELKRNIDFSAFDLFSRELSCPSASIFGDFDLVICANLLFYYKTSQQKQIVVKVGNCLANNGYLVAGEAERDILTRYYYLEVFPQSAIFKRNLQ